MLGFTHLAQTQLFLTLLWGGREIPDCIHLDVCSDSTPSEVSFLQLRVCVLGRGGRHGR